VSVALEGDGAMHRLETVSTTGVPASRKMRFWNEAVSSAVASAAADPIDEGSFQGQLRLLHLGDLRMVEVCGGASHVRRYPVRAKGNNFVLQLILSGEIVCRAEGKQTLLRAGDFWMYGTTAGAELMLSQPVSLLALCLPRDRLARYIGCPEAACSLVVPSTSGAGALVADYLRDFWNRAQHELSPLLLPRFAEIALQMIAGAYADIPDARPDGSSRVTEHRVRIRAFIEEHLCEADLTPKSVAEALRMTPGYLHRLFSDNGESVARYILRRRLEECHRNLTDCMQMGRSVTDIAFEHGFNSLPHFCRVFRNHFGATPSELRHSTAPPLLSYRQ
jgi:AraC family transcriptional regulator, positive regulator of tynA and feaB